MSLYEYTNFYFMLIEPKLTIKTWAEEDRPREKLQFKGKHSLSDAELLAIIIGSGNTTQSAVELSRQILSAVNNDLFELGRKPIDYLMQFKGIDKPKAAAASTTSKAAALPKPTAAKVTVSPVAAKTTAPIATTAAAPTAKAAPVIKEMPAAPALAKAATPVAKATSSKETAKPAPAKDTKSIAAPKSSAKPAPATDAAKTTSTKKTTKK